MVSQEGKRSGKKYGRFPKYFYLEDRLYRHIRINRGEDVIYAWCYPQQKRVALTYSYVREKKGPAYTTAEVGQMLNRSPRHIKRAIMEGNIECPQTTYGIDEKKNPYKFMWSEKDILNAHEFFSTQHYGRPRKDGIIVPLAIPTVRELRAMIRQEQVLFVKDGEEFVPVWRARDFS